MAPIQPGDSPGYTVHNAAIGLGSNLGNPLETIQKAWLDIQAHPGLFPVALSSPYHSEPVDMVSSRWFINAVGLVRTVLPPRSLLRFLQNIEQRHGRRHVPGQDGYDDRTLDLDLLLYEDAVISDEELTVPHPRMTERLFVMVPLVEVAAELIHPHHRKTMRTILRDLHKRKVRQKIMPRCWENGS